MFKRIEAITTKYGSKFYLLQSLHPFDTQTNEALNYSQACVTPKSKVFHTSKAFHYRHAITVGCHNWGFNKFWTRVFDELGVSQAKVFATFLETTTWKRKYWKTYREKLDVKRKRAYKQFETEKKQLYENNTKDAHYGPGLGLDIGFTAASSVTKTNEKKRSKRTQCRCGSTTHLTTRSKQCPLNKVNLNVEKEGTKENSLVDKVTDKNGAP